MAKTLLEINDNNSFFLGHFNNVAYLQCDHDIADDIYDALVQLNQSIAETGAQESLNGLIAELEQNNADEMAKYQLRKDVKLVINENIIVIDKLIYYYIKYSLYPPEPDSPHALTVEKFLNQINGLPQSQAIQKVIADYKLKFLAAELVDLAAEQGLSLRLGEAEAVLKSPYHELIISAMEHGIKLEPHEAEELFKNPHHELRASAIEQGIKLEFHELSPTTHVITSSASLPGFTPVSVAANNTFQALNRCEEELLKLDPKKSPQQYQELKAVRDRLAAKHELLAKLDDDRIVGYRKFDYKPCYVQISKTESEFQAALDSLPQKIQNHLQQKQTAEILTQEQASQTAIIKETPLTSETIKPAKSIPGQVKSSSSASSAPHSDVKGALGHLIKLIFNIPSRWRQGPEVNLDFDGNTSTKPKGYFSRVYEAGKLLVSEVSNYLNAKQPSSQAKILGSSIGKERKDEFYQGSDEPVQPTTVSSQSKQQIEEESLQPTSEPAPQYENNIENDDERSMSPKL